MKHTHQGGKQDRVYCMSILTHNDKITYFIHVPITIYHKNIQRILALCVLLLFYQPIYTNRTCSIDQTLYGKQIFFSTRFKSVHQVNSFIKKIEIKSRFILQNFKTQPKHDFQEIFPAPIH